MISPFIRSDLKGAGIMQKIPLGTSGMHVSKVCLGTMTFGDQNNESEAFQLLDYAFDRGINFIDTAEIYPVMPQAATQGLSETIIGNWLKKRGLRDKIVLATKVAGPSRLISWLRNGKNDLDEKNIRLAVEGSLRRLKTDYIDLYQLHWPSRNVPFFGKVIFNPKDERPSIPVEETLTVLGKLIDEGKIRHIGISNESAWGLMEFIKTAEAKGLPRIVSIQNAYNLTDRHFEIGMDEICFRENIGLIAYSPLAFGQLTGKYIDNPKIRGRLTLFSSDWNAHYRRPAVLEATRQYMQLAKDHGMTSAQLALAWCYSRWFIDATIIGGTKLEHLKENIDAISISLSDQIADRINEIHSLITNPGL